MAAESRSKLRHPTAPWPIMWSWLRSPRRYSIFSSGVAVEDGAHVLLLARFNSPALGFMRETLSEIVSLLNLDPVSAGDQAAAEDRLYSLGLDEESLSGMATIFQPCVNGSFIIRYVSREGGS